MMQASMNVHNRVNVFRTQVERAGVREQMGIAACVAVMESKLLVQLGRVGLNPQGQRVHMLIGSSFRAAAGNERTDDDNQAGKYEMFGHD